jgi:hypothetical protein
MAKQVKSTRVRARINIKQFYSSLQESLIKEKKFSPEAAAEIANTGLEEARAIEESQAAVEPRRREWQKILDDDFTKQMESSLGASSSARSENALVLSNFSQVGLRPEDSDAFAANAAAEAKFLLNNENAFRGDLKRSQGILNRTIGIFPKEERTATLVIKKFATSGGSEQDIVTIDEFLLTQVSEPSAEKYQIYQTFDQDFIFFFDRNPHIYVYSGVLINADDTFQWRNEFQREYEANLRGTKCVENGARAVLMFEDVTREGYLLDLNIQNSSNNPHHTPFSFTFYVIKESNNHKFRFSNEEYDEFVFGDS